MSARRTPRTSTCSRAEARERLQHAQRYVEAASLVLGEEEFAGVAASLAVLAGIAAADAACCARIGQRHRGQDHRAAQELLATVAPGGSAMARDLGRLLDRKDDAHYGLLSVAPADEGRMVEWAMRLVEGARTALEA